MDDVAGCGVVEIVVVGSVVVVGETFSGQITPFALITIIKICLN